MHVKFNEANKDFTVSYTVFCRLHPFWVVFQETKNREICLCIKHENMCLLVSRLKQLNVLSNGNVDELIENEMLCTPPSITCWHRVCEHCHDQVISVNNFEGTLSTE